MTFTLQLLRMLETNYIFKKSFKTYYITRRFSTNGTQFLILELVTYSLFSHLIVTFFANLQFHFQCVLLQFEIVIMPLRVELNRMKGESITYPPLMLCSHVTRHNRVSHKKAEEGMEHVKGNSWFYNRRFPESEPIPDVRPDGAFSKVSEFSS